MIIYNKLVRDLIPEIIQADGKSCEIDILDKDTYLIELKNKLSEEVTEYLEAENNKQALEELADILEIMQALAKSHNASIETVEKIRAEKAKKRGGFEERIFLKSVREND